MLFDLVINEFRLYVLRGQMILLRLPVAPGLVIGRTGRTWGLWTLRGTRARRMVEWFGFETVEY